MTVDVSVIMPAYNSAPFIREAIESVLVQEDVTFELIVVDDHSTDATYDIVRKHQWEDRRIRVFRQAENLGPAAARNRAIREASGRYIAFLDADDRWKPGKLARQIGHMRTTSSALSFTMYDLIDADGNRVGGSGILRPSIDYRGLLKGCLIQNSTAVYDTELTGGKVYCPDVPKRQDFGLFLAVLRNGRAATLVPSSQSECDYRITSQGISHKKSSNVSHQWKVYRQVENLSVPSSSYYMARWFIYAARKWHGRFRQ